MTASAAHLARRAMARPDSDGALPARPPSLVSVDTLPSASDTACDPAGPASRAGASPADLRVVPSTEIDARDGAMLEPLIEPVLCRGSVMLVRGPHGVGCTHVLLGCAVALASGGSFLGWRVPRPQSALLVAGAMPSPVLAARIAAAKAICGNTPPGKLLSVVDGDDKVDLLPDLGTASGRLRMMRAMAGKDVILIDDLACLLPGLHADPGAQLQELRHLLLLCRAHRCSFIIAQHSGQRLRGRADRAVLALLEAIADIVVDLRRPPGYRDVDGARFELHIERAAHLPGSQRRARLFHLVDRGDGRQVWLDEEADDIRKVAFVDLLADGADVRVAGSEIGISRATAYRWRREWLQRGDAAASDSSVRT